MSTLDLINAIAKGDAVASEEAFNSAMAERIAGKLDDMRQSVAQSMFNPQEQVSEPVGEPQGE